MISVWRAVQYESSSKSRRRIATISLLLLLSVSWSTIGCESDPLLAPQPEVEEKGSYGLSSFPGDEADPAPQEKSNPELF